MMDEGEDPELGGNVMHENVTVENWAMTRRQRVVRNISFESGSPYNIYDPKFTSEDENSNYSEILSQ